MTMQASLLVKRTSVETGFGQVQARPNGSFFVWTMSHNSLDRFMATLLNLNQAKTIALHDNEQMTIKWPTLSTQIYCDALWDTANECWDGTVGTMEMRVAHTQMN